MLDSNGQWIVYSGDTEESVWQIVMDVQGQVWARSHRGPAKIDPNSVDRTFSFLNSGMENSDAVALAIDPQGQVWALTRQRELRVLEANGNWRTVVIVPATVRNGFVDAFLAFDPQGQIWLATVQGVGVLSPDGTWKEHPLGDTSRPLSLYDVIADAEGRIWVAAFQPRSSRAQAFSGLFLFDPQTGWTNYSTRNSGIANDSTALAINPQGQVWIGSAHGTVSQFDPATSLPVNILPTVRFGTRALAPGILISFALLAVAATMRVQSGMGNTWQTFKFSLGFVAWYVIAAFVWVFLRFSYQQSSVGLLVINPLIVLAPVVHIVFMILLYVKERQMARGALSAMAVNSIAMMLMTPLSAGSLGSSLFGSLFMIPFFLLP